MTIGQLTPMLALMGGESVDRRERYEKRMRDDGMVKLTVWADPATADYMRALASAVRSADPLVQSASRSMAVNGLTLLALLASEAGGPSS